MMQIIRKLSEPKNLLRIGICYTLLITVSFFAPASKIPKIDFILIDKVVHALLHGVLCFIWLWYVFRNDQNHISSRNVFVVLVLCLSYGLAIEASQHWFTLTRTFDLFDVVANGVGSLLGLYVFWKLQKEVAETSKWTTNGNQEKPKL